MRNMNFKVNFSYRIGKLNAGRRPPQAPQSINNDDLKSGGDEWTGRRRSPRVVALLVGVPPQADRLPASVPQGKGNGQAPQGNRPAQAPAQAPANAPRN
jgi:hypothetical protein